MSKAIPEEQALNRLERRVSPSLVQAALFEAARKGWLGLLDRALALGADPNAPLGQLAPLNLASRLGQREHTAAVERLLTAGADPNRAHVVARCGVQALPLILDAGGSPDGTSASDRPLIHAIVQSVKPDKAIALLKLGANPDLTDEDGRVGLLLAARNGQTEIVRALLDCGADAFATTPDGKSALRLAAEGATGLGHAFSQASRRGARTIISLLSAGRLPTNPEDLVLTVLARDDVQELRRIVQSRLLCTSAQLDGSMGIGTQVDPLQLLRDQGVRARTPIDLIGSLLSTIREANPSTSVLAWAIGLDARKCCAELVRLGADPAQREPSGATPLDIARRLRRREIIVLLESKSQ